MPLFDSVIHSIDKTPQWKIDGTELDIQTYSALFGYIIESPLPYIYIKDEQHDTGTQLSLNEPPRR